MQLKEIGTIHSPYSCQKNTPKQGRESNEILEIEIYPEYQDACLGLEKGQKIVVIYWGDRADRTVLQNKKRGSGPITGIFNSRSPHRPNPLAINQCTIIELTNNLIKVTGLDAFDHSPLLDIKTALKN